MDRLIVFFVEDVEKGAEVLFFAVIAPFKAFFGFLSCLILLGCLSYFFRGFSIEKS